MPQVRTIVAEVYRNDTKDGIFYEKHCRNFYPQGLQTSYCIEI